MGQRGPAPEPRALRVLKGETRPSQLKDAPGPQDPPVQPDDLSPEAARLWVGVLASTADTAHIGASHAQTLRAFCETAAAANAMKPKGSKEWRELVNANRQLARELCLTPATSGGLVRKNRPASKLDKYLAS